LQTLLRNPTWPGLMLMATCRPVSHDSVLAAALREIGRPSA